MNLRPEPHAHDHTNSQVKATVDADGSVWRVSVTEHYLYDDEDDIPSEEEEVEMGYLHEAKYLGTMVADEMNITEDLQRRRRLIDEAPRFGWPPEGRVVRLGDVFGIDIDATASTRRGAYRRALRNGEPTTRSEENGILEVTMPEEILGQCVLIFGGEGTHLTLGLCLLLPFADARYADADAVRTPSWVALLRSQSSDLGMIRDLALDDWHVV